MAKKRSARQSAPKKERAPDAGSQNPYEIASPVAGVARLNRIFMDDSQARRAVKTSTEADGVEILINTSEAEVSANRDKNSFFIRVRFHVNVYPKKGSEGENPLAEVMARFVALYEVESFEGISEDNLEAFAKTSGIFSLWPYFREYVHSMTLKMSVPAIVLPTYRM